MLQRLMVSFCLIFSSTAFAEGLVILKDSKSYREGDSFVSELTFNGPVSADQVSFEFINKTVQANIKNAGINSGKETKEMTDEKVASVFNYQFEPGLMRSRVIYRDSKASEFKGRVRTEASGNTLKIILDDTKAVAAVEAAAPEKAETAAAQPPIDLDKELERALKIEASDETVYEKQEEAALAAAAAEVGAGDAKAEKVERAAASVENDEANIPLAKAETAEEKAAKSEADIPLGIDSKKVKAAESTPWMRLLISLGVVAVVGLGLVVGVKKVAKDKRVVGGNVKIKVVSQHSLGPKKSLAVIHVAGESLLVGVTDNNINLIKSLALIDDEIIDEEAHGFEAQMRQVSQGDRYTRTKTLGAVPPKDQAQLAAATKEDEFLIGNIKDLVNSKLNGMRTL